MKKKLISSILAFCMILSLLPATALALDAETEYTATFKVQNSDGDAIDNPTITVTYQEDSEEKTVAATGDSYTLTAGTEYSYTVAAEGYENATGTIEEPDTDTTVEVVVTMTAEDSGTQSEAYTVTFAVKDNEGKEVAGAAIVVKDSENNTIAAEAAGSYELTDGNYTYTVTATGYVTATGNFTVNGEDDAIEVTMTADSGTPSETYTVTFAIKDDANTDVAGAAIVVKDSENNTIAAEADGSYELTDGNYTYTVTATGYETATGNFTVNGEDDAIEVTMTADSGEDKEISSVAITLVPAAGVEVGDTLPQASTTTAGVTLTTVWKNENGTTVTEAEAAGDYTATITVKADEGYTLATGVECTLDGVKTEVTTTELTLTKTITVEAPAPTYNINISATPNGYGTAKSQVNGKDVTAAAEGDKVTIVITPATGYEIASVTFDGDAEDWDEDEYTFTMPAAPVEVTITFKEIPTVAASAPATVTNGTATATVNADTVSEALEGVTETGTTFAIDATKNDQDSEVTADAAAVTLPTEAITAIAGNNKVTHVEVSTPAGTIILPTSTLSTVAQEANEGVTLVIEPTEVSEDVETTDTILPYEVYIMPESGTGVDDAIEVKNTTITLKLPTTGLTATQDDPIVVIYIDDNGGYTEMDITATDTTKGTVTFTTEHLSTYALMLKSTAVEIGAIEEPGDDGDTNNPENPETPKVTCAYNHKVGLFGGQLKLTGLDANSKYVCQMAKVGETGSHAGYAIVVFETGANETTQTIEVLGNANGYYVDLYKYPNSNPSSITEFPTESHVIENVIAK